MAPALIFDILDRLLRRICEAEDDGPMFAGKVILFGGDMRQLGPIPNDGQTMEQLHFRNSEAFAEAQIYSLGTNMRTLPEEVEFAKFLRDVGNGVATQKHDFYEDTVRFPKTMIVEDRQLSTLIKWTFGSKPSISGAKSAILTPFNKDCTLINKQIMENMPGKMYTMLSEDSVVDDSTSNRLLAADPTTLADQGEVDKAASRRLVHQDELHQIMETGMPPHVLELKIGVIVNLIKNLDVRAGLVNGCRLRVKKVSRDHLDCEIISDFPHLTDDQRNVSFPRVRFLKACSHALVMQRVQFPVRVAFACTINKSQGLTLKKVSILNLWLFTCASSSKPIRTQ